MEVLFGPNSVDEPSLLYKLQRKVKVFNTVSLLPNRGYNLVASSSKYGIVFVASPNGILLVYYLKELIDKETEGQHLAVKLHENPTHVAVSCDQELLSVTGGQLLCIFKVADFQNENVSPSVTLKCDVNPGTFVSALQWNPCIPDSIVIAFYDGTLLTCQVSTAQIKKVQSKCRCLCWSPKGKQFVTGNSDGTLTQYKPDLTPAKTVPAPNLFESSPVEALAVYWISTFQFAVVYKNATNNSRPAVTIINTPKAGQPSCLNYEDICYSMGSNRPWYYYLQGLAPWNIILTSSSNSMEIASLGSTDGASWMQWCQTDEARPELPLTDKKQENYPVGIWIDTCAVHQLPWGENETLPPMPTLLVVSQTGLLTLFNVINLNKQAPQLCSPPQLLALPASAMNSDIPDEAPQVISQVATPKPQPVAPQLQPTTQPTQAIQSATPQFGSNLAGSVTIKPANGIPPPSQPFASNISQLLEQNQPAVVKPAPQIQPQPTNATAPKEPAPASPVQPTPEMQETYAAMKAEQERIKAIKANQELKNMLIKEVNEFQMELYKFMVNTRDTQVKLQQDIEGMNYNMNMKVTDAEELKKDLCSLEELRNAIVQLKLELVRSCAAVAEARTCSDAKDIQEWTQADPLTTKRVASVKKLAYYVQNQVEQAQRALDHKWNDTATGDPSLNKSGQRMIRPILDDVYQPLVKQQEILSRQQAVLRSLKNTLKEMDITPMFKSSLLRNTPFKNKDPLSKLTKNILNMSIEPQTKPKESCLSAQKLDALRDMLSNHKMIKVKPVNVELRQQLATIKTNYEKSLKEKAAAQIIIQQVDVKKETQLQSIVTPPTKPVVKQPIQSVVAHPVQPQRIAAPHALPSQVAPTAQFVKYEPKQEFTPSPINAPFSSFTGSRFSNNSIEPKQNTTTVASKIQPQIEVNLTSTPKSSASATTKSVLKDLLQNKQAQAVAAAIEAATAKFESNSFLGQKICSPNAFSVSISNVPADTTTSTTASKVAVANPTIIGTKFSGEPLSNINIPFSKFQTKPDSKPTLSNAKKSLETAEQNTVPNTQESKKMEKPLSDLSDTKSFVPLVNKPAETKQREVSKIDVKIQELTKPDPIEPAKIILKAAEKSKENIPEKVNEIVPQELQKPVIEKTEAQIKALNMQNINIASALFQVEVKSLDTQNTNNAPSLFTPSVQTPITTADVLTSESQKPAEVTTESKKEITKDTTKAESPTTSSASSLFAAANASSPPASKPQIVFSSTAVPSSPTGSIFGTSQPTTPTSPTNAIEKPALFAPTTSTSASSLFSAAIASQPVSTQASSLFGTTPSTGSSVFGSTSPGSLFGTTTTTTSSSLFGTSTTPSVFSSDAKPKPSVFSSTPSTPTSVFGTTDQSASAPSPSSVFAAASQPSVFAATTAGCIFGTATTTQASLFGTSTSTTNAFGTATTQPSVFGITTTTTAQNVFGTATSQASVFGSPATTAQSVFGSGTATSQSSVFGTPSTPTSVFGQTTPTNQGSIFGSPSTQGSVFGTPNQTSVFGSPTQTTQASVFGSAPVSTAQTGSLFGGAESNMFAAASISTTSAQSPGSGGNIFGSSPSSVFGGSGGNTNVFGGKTSFSQSNPSATSIFGGGAAFGQKPATNFWSGGNNAAGTTGFGSGFGQQPSTQASSLFGGSSGGSFSAATTPAQPFGSPQPSAFGSGDNKTSVFGSPQQQNVSAFGGSPVFGSKPAFAQTASFGSPPSSGFGAFGGFNKSPGGGFGAPASFGGGATFGGTAFGNTSPSKVFGGSPPAFGSPTQSNATFENLATQNTLTFGNLAQQSGQAPQSTPSFGASPAFTGWRG